MKNSLLFQEISFITNSQVATFCYLYLLPGGKLGFQVAKLLLATVNFEPRVEIQSIKKIFQKCILILFWFVQVNNYRRPVY